MKKTYNMSVFITAFVKLTGYIPAMIFLKPKVYKENTNCRRNLKSGSILMSNHTSLMDFVLYLMVFPFRSIQFLMAEVLYNKGKLFSWFLYKIGGIFVNRDACNFSFIEDSAKAISKKRIVGIFPQGRLPFNGQTFPFKPGVVLVALKTNSPVIPVYTDGNYGLFKRAHVMIGEEINLIELATSCQPDDAELMRLTKHLEDKVYSLKNELEKRLNTKNG